MKNDHFVGRHDAVTRVQNVLTGQDRAKGKLVVQSIEGPGGIGKTFLLDHALAGVDLGFRNYLILRIDGSDTYATSLVRAVGRMVDGADAPQIKHRTSGYFFPSVDMVVKAIDSIRNEAISEFKKRNPDVQNGETALLRFLDWAIENGKRLNASIPGTRKRVDFRELENLKPLLEDTIPKLTSLLGEMPGWWERLGLGGTTALKNSIRENACRPLSDALFSDLSAILAGYPGKDLFKTSHSKIEGIDRFLLIIDDYEKLQAQLSEFLLGYFLPALRNAKFESVVLILGRDQLEATHPGWDQHFTPNLLQRISLIPLDRPEMDQLVESFGVHARDEKDRAWRDTQGYPLYVHLWIEEAASGGRTAVMLKRFHDRTTRWMGDREKVWLQHTLFIDEVNRRTLRQMLGSEQEANEAYMWFEREGSVRDTSGTAFRVREYLRSRLVDYIKISDPDRYEQLRLKGQAAMQFEGHGE